MYWVQDILGTALNYQKFGFIAAEALADSQVYEEYVYDAREDSATKSSNTRCMLWLCWPSCWRAGVTALTA